MIFLDGICGFFMLRGFLFFVCNRSTHLLLLKSCYKMHIVCLMHLLREKKTSKPGISKVKMKLLPMRIMPCSWDSSRILCIYNTPHKQYTSSIRHELLTSALYYKRFDTLKHMRCIFVWKRFHGIYAVPYPSTFTFW